MNKAQVTTWQWELEQMRWRQVRGPFYQVLFFSAKFVACLPSLVQTLHRVSAKFLALSAKFKTPSWQKSANSKPLAIFCQLRATQYKNHEFQHRCVQWLRVGIFCQWSCVGREHKTWQKTHKLGRSKPRKQKQGGKSDTERCNEGILEGQTATIPST